MPGGAHLHAHLAAAGPRIGSLLDAQHLGRAVLGDHECPHGGIISGRAACSVASLALGRASGSRSLGRPGRLYPVAACTLDGTPLGAAAQGRARPPR